MRARWLASLMIVVALAAGVAGARAAGIDDCEKIKDADAYNRCLASHGPAFRGSRVAPMAPGAEAPRAVRRRSGYTKQPARVRSVIRPSGGRARMEFTVNPRGRR